MSPDEARALFLEHCEPGDRGTLERYGEKAAVAAIMAATGWQSIETAPKDGHTYIDVWTTIGERVTEVVWNIDRKRWQHWHIGGFETMEWVKVDGTPTHWMAVPSAPDAA